MKTHKGLVKRKLKWNLCVREYRKDPREDTTTHQTAAVTIACPDGLPEEQTHQLQSSVLWINCTIKGLIHRGLSKLVPVLSFNITVAQRRCNYTRGLLIHSKNQELQLVTYYLSSSVKLLRSWEFDQHFLVSYSRGGHPNFLRPPIGLQCERQDARLLASLTHCTFNKKQCSESASSY